MLTEKIVCICKLATDDFNHHNWLCYSYCHLWSSCVWFKGLSQGNGCSDRVPRVFPSNQVPRRPGRAESKCSSLSSLTYIIANTYFWTSDVALLRRAICLKDSTFFCFYWPGDDCWRIIRGLQFLLNLTWICHQFMSGCLGRSGFHEESVPFTDYDGVRGAFACMCILNGLFTFCLFVTSIQLFRKGFLREMCLVYAIRNAIACFIFTCERTFSSHLD